MPIQQTLKVVKERENGDWVGNREQQSEAKYKLTYTPLSPSDQMNTSFGVVSNEKMRPAQIIGFPTVTPAVFLQDLEARRFGPITCLKLLTAHTRGVG